MTVHVLPASFAQRRLWFVTQLAPDVAVFTIGFLLPPLRSADEVARFERALATVVARHETLRTALATRDGEVVQVVHGVDELPLPPLVVTEVDTQADASDADVERRCEELVAADSGALPFDLETAPLWRAGVFHARRDAGDVWWPSFAVHHAVFDARSAWLLITEVWTLLRGDDPGDATALPELPIQYADFAAWQRDQVEGGALADQLAWWRDRLDGAPPEPALPFDRARPAKPSHRGGDVTFTLPADVNAAVKALAAASGSTQYAVLLAAFTTVLRRLAGSDDVVLGSPVAGRPLPELTGLIGMFVNSLVLRVDASGDPTFRELLGRATDTVMDALEHSDVPFDKLVEELAPDRDGSRPPLYQVVLNLMPATGNAQQGNGTSKVDLILDVFDTPDGALGGRLEYASDLFDEATARAIADRFAQVVRAAVAAPDTRVRDLPVLLPHESAATTAPRAPLAPAPLLARIERHVAERPHAVAVRDSGGTELTYDELWRAATGLAGALAEVGAGPDRPVGLLLPTSADAVVAALACLVADAPYLPLDPAHPHARVTALLADARAVAVVTGEARDLGDLPVVAPSAACPLRGEPAAPHPGRLAHVVYTSGSTGRPKGVGVTRGNLDAYVDGVLALLGPLDPGLTWAMPQPLTYDFGVTTLWGALATGGTLCPIDADHAKDAAWLAARPHDVLKITPSHLVALRAAVPDPDAVLPRRLLVLGGEASPMALVRELRTRVPVVNHYGPTETTVGVLALAADRDARPVGDGTPIGVAMAHATAHVLDRHGLPVPDGVVGELHVGGDSVSRGYLGQPGLTADRFVPDPFSGVPGARLYRTGDRARRLRTGEIEFLGRADDQVKIRGHRVEPGEARHVVAATPGVTDAAVVARPDDTGAPRLVAYVVGDVEPAAVREHAATLLPEHLVPAAVVVLDALPRTPHGKLDRAALPEPAAAVAEAAFAAPRGELEEVVAGLFAQLLGRDADARIARDDNFFAIGGHSLLGIQLMARLRAAFGAALPLRAMFEDPTPMGLAARMAAKLRGAGGRSGSSGALGAGADAPIERLPAGAVIPASHGQQRLWFLDQLDPGVPLYNTHFALRLTGALDTEALRLALLAIVRRHDVLRTTFHATADGLAQVVADEAVLPFETADLPRDASDRDRWQLMTAFAERPFDLAAGPLIRALLVRRTPAAGAASAATDGVAGHAAAEPTTSSPAASADEHELLLTLHHTVFDGSSVAVLVGELAALYPAIRDGRDPGSVLPGLDVQYGDFAAWQRAVVAADGDGQLAHWRRALAGLPPRLELPTDRPRPPRPGPAGEHQLFAVPDDVAATLRAIAAAEDATLYMALLAGYAALLRRWTGQDDVAVGVPLITRGRPELDRLVGFFVNTLVLRVAADGDPSYRDLVRLARAATVGAYSHADVPFEAVVDAVAPDRDQSVSPLVQTMFMLADDQRALVADLGGVRAEFEPFALGHAKFDVSVFLWRRADGLTGAIEYRPDLFDDGTVRRFVASFTQLLAAAAADPDTPLSRLSVRPPAPAEPTPAPTESVTSPLVAGPAAAESASPPVTGSAGDGVTVVELIAERVRTAPTAIAVRDGAAAVTYAELWDRAGRVAATLRPGTLVGVCVPRSADLLAALVGVLRAGAAYVPLDPDYPPDRLALVVADAAAAALVVTPETAGVVPFDGPVVSLADLDADTGGADADRVAPTGPTPAHAAYVLHTSGSTGVPKGVVIGHRALASQLRWVAAEFALTVGDRVAQRTPIGFDASVWELFAPLVAGASVVIAPAAASTDPDVLADVLTTHGVTVLQLVPSLLAAHADAGALARVPSLRLLGVGGEPLPAELADRVATQTAARIVNLYGPTECCVQATAATARPGSGRPTVPIGTPVPGVTAHVVDAAGVPVPDGVPGELWLGGVQVAHGYHARPSLTAERFVPDPWTPGGRLYRTGDRVRLLPSGELEHLGRVDEQVKVRGVRVELGEVRAALADLPGVTAAAVVPRDGTLVGYVTVSPDATATAADLRDTVRRRLPSAVVPSAIVVLDALPLLPNGKVDRAALPAPEIAAAAAYVAPATPTEEVLCGLYARLLGRDRVGTRDDFFALGGHSLLVTRLVTAVRHELGVELTLRRCFDAPTVAELAAVVLEEQLAGEDAADLDALLRELSQEEAR